MVIGSNEKRDFKYLRQRVTFNMGIHLSSDPDRNSCPNQFKEYGEINLARMLSAGAGSTGKVIGSWWERNMTLPSAAVSPVGSFLSRLLPD